MATKIFEYRNCSTCQKAIKFLREKGVEFETIPIVDQPPSLSLLTRALKDLKGRGLGLKQLFNTSGVLYRDMKISEKLKGDQLSEVEALKLLSTHGKLIKRPLLVTDAGVFAAGFQVDVWTKILGL